jgi:P27 family predicted phage terminase small subunit
MAMSGRKPKPVEQRRAEGNPRKHAIPSPVMVGGRPKAEDLVPPEHLHDDAKEFWRSIVKQLIDIGIADRVDVPVLEQLATQYHRIRAAQRAIAIQGHFTTGSMGQPKEHPAVKMEREATRLFLQLAEHYALTPIARTRLGLADVHRRTLEHELEENLLKPNFRKLPVKPVKKARKKPVSDEIVDAVVVEA